MKAMKQVRPVAQFIGILILLFTASFPKSMIAQDTIFLFGDTIRVGELEWDMEKDWRARGSLLSENKDLYGKNVRIFLDYYPNKMAEQITFGYVDSLGNFIAHGPARYFYPDGQLLSKRYFEEGKMHGPARDFYTNTKVKVISRFQNDTLDGPYESFYDNGIREQKAYYKRGRPEGAYRAWYANGKRKWVEWYQNGLKYGADSSYFETGKLESVIYYRGDKMEGLATVFHRNGKVWTERLYDKGRLMEVRFLKSKDGRPLEIGSFKNGNAWLNVYNDDGILIAKEKYRNGYLRKEKQLK